MLAILFAATIMMSCAQAASVMLPQSSGDPVTAPVLQNTPESADSSDLLQVFVGPARSCCEGRTPIAGHYERTNDRVTFSPAFGFDAGQDYVVRIPRGQSEELIQFNIPSDITITAAKVTEIYPSGDTLPENILRFYIHFSVPMQPHVAFDHITLRDASGNADEAAFMRFKQELWNEDRTRLTVLIDPGRIKRNVATNVELGPALLEGQDYTLTIKAGWPSADGASVLPEFSKHFMVGPPLRNLPDVKHWRVTTACIGSRDTLKIAFDRPFDRHLLTQHIRVASKDGHPIEGSIEIGSGERLWTFKPNANWPTDHIQINVDPRLEDVAANNFHDLLDHVASETSGASSIVLPVARTICTN